MIRRLFRRMFRLALVLGAAAAVYKVVQARRPSPALPESDAWPPTPRPVPAPPQAAPAATRRAEPVTEPGGAKTPPTPRASAAKKAPANDVAKAAAPWVEAVDGECPPTHPVKAKLASKIYHLPGMLAYDRTRPDRCYRDGESAEADGLRKAKR